MIRHIRASALWCLAIVVVFPSYAQQQEHTLGSLWPKVEENYPAVGARVATIDAAKFNSQVVKDNLLPQVNTQAQNTYGSYQGSSGGFFPQPGFFNVSASTPLSGSSAAANTFASATIEWELFSFGKNRLQNKAAEALYGKAVSEKDAYLLELKKTLSARYILLLYNNAKLQWSEKNGERLNDIRHITSGLSASGLRPAADSLLASSSYIQALGERDKWIGFKQAALIQLAELYGDDTIHYSTSTNRFINPVQYHEQDNMLNALHPALDVLNKQADYYSWSGQAVKKALLPSVKLLGGYAFRGSGISPNGTVSGAWKDGFSNGTNNFLAGIGITWNLTNLHTGRLKEQKLIQEAQSTKFSQTQHERVMQA